ncbi:response regulator [Pseudomonas sp. ZS001]|uniref:response regulator n=1 Tax=Pseudomonas sp. ZS001 TaxID=3138070 RepID=UPI00313A440C
MILNWEGVGRIDGEVLIVEDEPTLRRITQHIVEELGAKAVSFGNADEALAYLLQSRQHCCLVITDYGVPGQINGMDFIHVVGEKWPAVKTILMSGYELLPATVPAPTVYLQKPWTVEELLLSISSLLQPDAPIAKL